MAKTVSSGAATKTLQLRLKDKHSGFLRQQACAVNFAWNFCNELSVKHFDRKRAFLSAYDMQPYTKGAGAELGLHSQTIQAIQEEYVTRRKQFKRVKLRWRVLQKKLRLKRGAALLRKESPSFMAGSSQLPPGVSSWPVARRLAYRTGPH